MRNTETAGGGGGASFVTYRSNAMSIWDWQAPHVQYLFFRHCVLLRTFCFSARINRVKIHIGNCFRALGNLFFKRLEHRKIVYIIKINVQAPSKLWFSYESSISIPKRPLDGFRLKIFSCSNLNSSIYWRVKYGISYLLAANHY